MPSLSISFEAHRFTLSQDDASRSNSRYVIRHSRYLWTGFGFVVLMLIGVPACAMLPLAAHASAEPSGHVAALMPGPDIMRYFIEDIRDQNMMQEQVQHDLVKMAGIPPRSGLVMSSVLDRPKVGISQSSKEMEAARARLERQFARTPAPPPPPPTTPPPGGGGGGGDEGRNLYLKRFSDAEADTILSEWIAHSKLYSWHELLPGSMAEAQKAKMQQLESFRSFVEVNSSASAAGADTPMRAKFLGLYDEQDGPMRVTFEAYSDEGEILEATKDKAFYGLYSPNSNKTLAMAGGLSFALYRTSQTD